MIPLLDLLSPVIGKILDFIPDAKTKAEAQLKFQEELNRHQEVILNALSAVDQRQADVNVAEASITGSDGFKLFMAGWRPALGWVCTLAFAWAFVFQPISIFILRAFHNPTEFPVLNLSELITVLIGMLGLSTQRMWEKYQEVQNNH